MPKLSSAFHKTQHAFAEPQDSEEPSFKNTAVRLYKFTVIPDMTTGFGVCVDQWKQF